MFLFENGQFFKAANLRKPLSYFKAISTTDVARSTPHAAEIPARMRAAASR